MNQIDHKPAYGVTENYLGTKGKHYFRLLTEWGEINALANQRFWKPYVVESDSVLDFGCGNGDLLKLLHCQKKAGVEINPYSRSFAERELEIDVFEDTTSIEDNEFSKIIVSHVLEHLPAPYQALLELHRIIKAEGILLMLIPLEDWRASGQRVFVQDDIDQHLYAWTPKLLGNLLWQANFFPLELRIATHAPPGRFTKFLLRLPAWAFNSICWFFALLRRRRQIFIVARPR